MMNSLDSQRDGTAWLLPRLPKGLLEDVVMEGGEIALMISSTAHREQELVIMFRQWQNRDQVLLIIYRHGKTTILTCVTT